MLGYILVVVFAISGDVHTIAKDGMTYAACMSAKKKLSTVAVIHESRCLPVKYASQGL